MSVILIKQQWDEWNVWIGLGDGDPSEEGVGFVIGNGRTRDEAVAAAVVDISTALYTLQSAPSQEASSLIRVGDRVTITNRFGQARTGRAVLRGPYAWVLDMGGPHGTPAVAEDEYIVRVKRGRSTIYPVKGE